MVCDIDVWKLLSDEYGDYNVYFFLMTTRHGIFPFDGWLMFDGLQYTCLSDVTSKMWQLLSVEVQNVDGDYSEIRMQHTISSLI